MQYGASLTPLAIQFTPASVVELFTVGCLALRNDLVMGPSAHAFPWLSPNVRLDSDLGFLNLKLPMYLRLCTKKISQTSSHPVLPRNLWVDINISLL